MKSALNRNGLAFGITALTLLLGACGGKYQAATDAGADATSPDAATDGGPGPDAAPDAAPLTDGGPDAGPDGSLLAVGSACGLDPECSGPEPDCLEDDLQPLASFASSESAAARALAEQVVIPLPDTYCSNEAPCTSDADCGALGRCFLPLIDVPEADFQELVDALALSPDESATLVGFRTYGQCLRPCDDALDCPREGYTCAIPLEGFLSMVADLGARMETYCIGEPGPCSPNPCEHGDCTVTPDESFTCACDPGWLGERCEAPDPCVPSPCVHGGTCGLVDGQPVCSGCDPGWSGARCDVPFDCGHPGAPLAPLAVDVTAGTTLGAVATYTCDAPYLLSGDATRTCTATGWSGDAPMCLDPPPRCEPGTCNGHGTCVEVSSQFDHCACQDGWTGSFCETLVDCGALVPADPNLSVTYVPGLEGVDTSYGAAASHACATGYNLVGAVSRTCDASGQWSGVAPTCAAVDCGAPAATAPLQVATPGGTTYGQTASYACTTGYSLVGDASATCQAGGTWSGTRSCAVVTCGAYTPTDPNLQVLNPTDTIYGSTAQLVCRPGYGSTGGTAVTCGVDAGGQPAWLGTAPTCVQVTCDPAAVPGLTNGSVSVIGTGPGGTVIVGDVASYACSPGWDLNADPADPVVCQADGTWGGSVPTCAEGLCAVLAAPGHGTVAQPDRTADGVATYACDAGYVMQVSGAPWGGSTYARTCAVSGSDLAWTGVAPTCAPRDCGAPPAVTNAAAPAYSTTTFGSTAIYACLDGYGMSGGPTITCGADGAWTSPPSCAAVDCGAPPVAGANAERDPYGATTFGATVTYRCLTGYVPVSGSTSSVTCLATAAWSAAAGLVCEEAPQTCTPDPCDHGTCVEAGGVFDRCDCTPGWSGDVCNVPVDCGAPPAAGAHAALLDVSTTTLDGTATYECLAGYTPESGEDVLTCEASGDWSDPPLACTPVSCGAAPTVGAGVTISNPQAGYVYGQAVQYACVAGYAVSGGSASQACQADGTFAGAPLACDLDTTFCTAPPVPAPTSHAALQSSTGQFLGATADYVCAAGYVPASGHVTPATLTCGESGGAGVWEGTALSCVPVDCGAPPAAPLHGSRSYTTTTLGATTVYDCDPGYDLGGVDTITCEAGGLWSGPAPTCAPVSCGAPPAQDGDFSQLDSSTGTTFGATADYVCQTGYTGSGATLTCGASGTWAGGITSCAIVTCPPDPVAALGPGVVRTDGGGSTYGTVATFSCDAGSGYEWTSGSGTTQTCTAAGSWQGTVACQLHDCGAPAAGTQASLSYTSTTFGSSAIWSCVTGHDPVSPGTDPLAATCALTGWSVGPLACAPVDCGAPAAAPANGTLTYTSTTFGSVATYACDAGFDLVGTAQVTCLDTALWSGGAPTCVAAQPEYCDVLYRLTGEFRVSNAPASCGNVTNAVGQNNSNPALDGGATTPFTSTSEFRRAFMRLRFPASGGEPVTGTVSLVEYYLPMEFLVSCSGANVDTNVDHSLGLLAMSGTPPAIPASPTISRPCAAQASGQLAGALLDWTACTVTPPATGNGWSHDDAQADAGDTTTACAMRMSVWGSVKCTGGLACLFVTGLGNQRNTWDQLLQSFTFSGPDLRSATFSMPEVQVPESTSESQTRTWVKITLATPEHVECGTVTELTCDEEIAP